MADEFWRGVHSTSLSAYITTRHEMTGPRGLFGISLFVLGQRLQVYFGRWWIEVHLNN